jgi:hypothetical protein
MGRSSEGISDLGYPGLDVGLISLASDWIFSFCPTTYDMDSQRVGFLRIFGIPGWIEFLHFHKNECLTARTGPMCKRNLCSICRVEQSESLELASSSRGDRLLDEHSHFHLATGWLGENGGQRQGDGKEHLESS